MFHSLIAFVDLRSCEEMPLPIEKYWVKELKLVSCDKDIIVKGAWLTDTVINAGLMLMKKAFPHILGLQETSLGETLSFAVSKANFVQILNVGRNHWITVSSSGELF